MMMPQPALLHWLLSLLLLPSLTTATRSQAVCNTSAYPWPLCQPACQNATPPGPNCSGSRSRHLSSPSADSSSSSRVCLRCAGTVCTMSVPADTNVPETARRGTLPAPGKRVVLTAAGFEHTQAFHTLMLPREWSNATKTKKWPVLVEFPGNGCGPGGPPELNDCGSVWTCQGWGVAEGRRYIWLTLPFLTADQGNDTSNSMYWWGCGHHGVPGGPASSSCNESVDSFTPNTTLRCAHHLAVRDHMRAPASSARNTIRSRRTVGQVCARGHPRHSLAVWRRCETISFCCLLGGLSAEVRSPMMSRRHGLCA
jgi:hypothetical protein